MANVNAPRDDNAVPTAVFAQQGATNLVAPGQIDQITGRILVDVTGGVSISTSTLNQEVPSGTVNGVNTVFTVLNVPIFMEVSGQIMVSSVQNPANYGYTLSGLTVTFVNAPTQSPDSFYNNQGAGTALASALETDSFTATANQTVFTTTLVPTFIFGVYVQGQLQTLNVDYTQVGSTFTLTTGAVVGNSINICYAHN